MAITGIKNMKTRFTLTTKGPAVLFPMILVGSLLISGIANASWAAVPLNERIKDADLVVLGQLVDVKPKYYSITYNIGEESSWGLGEHELAMESMQKALDAHDGGLVYVNTNPRFEPLRKDPRFVNILEEMNLHSGS